MREILFRGYSKNVKRFIYGDLTHFENEIRIIEKNNYCYLVDPETVGQFTGITDKNGVKIFEHDKVKWADEDTIYTVEYDRGSFVCVNVDTSFNLSDYSSFEYELI